MRSVLLAAIVVYFSCGGISAESSSKNGVTSCFYCESQKHPNCKNHHNTTATIVNCDKFWKSQDPSEAVQRTGALTVSRNIAFMKTLNEQRQKRDAETTTFSCTKMEVRHHTDDTLEVIRMCAPRSPTVDSVCNYLSENMEENYSMGSCKECDTDNCNGSASLQVGLFTITLVLTLIMLR